MRLFFIKLPARVVGPAIPRVAIEDGYRAAIHHDTNFPTAASPLDSHVAAGVLMSTMPCATADPLDRATFDPAARNRLDAFAVDALATGERLADRGVAATLGT